MKHLPLLLLFSLLSFSTFAQKKSNKKEHELDKTTFFGVGLSSMHGSNFIYDENKRFTSDTAQYSILYNNFNYKLGFEIKHFFTYRFALITGLYYGTRKINIDYSSNHPALSQALYGYKDTTFTGQLKFIGYEIPIHAMGYVRLSNLIYMNIHGGVNLNFFPSNIQINNTYLKRDGTFNSLFFQLGYTVGVGWELRTKDSGIFYIGASYQAKQDYMGAILFFEKRILNSPDYFEEMKGQYFSIDLKYYFNRQE